MYVFSNSKLNFHCGIYLSYLLLFYLEVVFSSLVLVGMKKEREVPRVTINFIL